MKLKAEVEKETAALLERQNFTVCQTNKSLRVFQEFPNNFKILFLRQPCCKFKKK